MDEKMIMEAMMNRMKEEQARKARNFRTLNEKAIKGGILFTGSSLMEMFPICEMATSAGIKEPIYNRGIGGTTTDDFLREIDAVLLGLSPSRVFLNIGTNDITTRVYGEGWMDHLFANYEEILKRAMAELEGVQIYMMAFYPANTHLPWLDEQARQMFALRTVENLQECNRRLEELAGKVGQHYINVNEGLTDEKGELRQEYTFDGVHMYAEAYGIVFENLKKYL